MNGQDILVILSQGGVALASTHVKSQDIQTECSTIEKASATQQDWVDRIAGRKSWQMSINYLVMRAAQIRDLLYVGQTFDITVRDRDNTTGGSISGTAIMTGVHGVSSVGNLATGSFTLQGSGPLT